MLNRKLEFLLFNLSSHGRINQTHSASSDGVLIFVSITTGVDMYEEAVGAVLEPRITSTLTY